MIERLQFFKYIYFIASSSTATESRKSSILFSMKKGNGRVVNNGMSLRYFGKIDKGSLSIFLNDFETMIFLKL
jgi:hypothetical protein